MTHPKSTALIFAAAENVAGVNLDLIELLRNGVCDQIEEGQTVVFLADALRLLIEATADGDEGANQLHGALVRFIEDRT